MEMIVSYHDHSSINGVVDCPQRPYSLKGWIIDSGIPQPRGTNKPKQVKNTAISIVLIYKLNQMITKKVVGRTRQCGNGLAIL
jgi:hypothetical protein